MNPTTKNAIAMLVVVIAIGLSAWLYLWQLTNEYTRLDEEKGKSLETLQRQWAKATNDNLLYRHRYSEAQDTIVELTRQIGWVETELGVKKDELRQANARYKNSRQVKDTARALSICDSIVYTFVPAYLYTDSVSEMYGDSLHEFTGKWLVNQNGVIEGGFVTIDSTFQAAITEKTKEKKQDKKENRKRKGEIVKAGFFGAAIGVLLALIFGG
jgi:hypothetical protein